MHARDDTDGYMKRTLTPTMEAEQKWWIHGQGAHSDYGARAESGEDGGSLLRWMGQHMSVFSAKKNVSSLQIHLYFSCPCNE